MKYLKILSVALGLSAIIHTASAQFIHQRDFKPITTIDYTNVDGTPYLYDTWQQGMVKLANGVSSKDKMPLKYNLVDDLVSFKDKESGEEMAFVVPVQEFTLNLTTDDELFVRHFRSGYKGIEGSTPASFFEVLSDGKIQLIKKFNKVVFETQNIGSASKTRSFLDKTKYYIVNNGKALQVKNDKKSLLAALGDKQAQMEDYIKTNKVNFKSDTQLGKLVDYYNSL
ncbi:hypothetical protein IDJ77_00090 [Mucilaginibacter sp. ZT4R22]|uniref:Uncharacterized protein n=1 Tax=Mucilaginibacter pankratovii TaxID=2772110 RepID=A0ABR7WLK7_9SPHI|nr:hypothetical protein [Mucilaginibacter pankratovii]MBD1362192.1 hypothetical protein [Mucilaginibacter pankratovii]